MKIRSIINKLRGMTDIPSLVKKGLIIGNNVFINYGCIIDEHFCWLITIGNNVTFAPNVHILAHDASTKKTLGCTKIGKVKIGNDVFVGAGVIVLPGCKIGNRVVIGAGSVVTKDIPNNSVAAGSPARVICSYDDYMYRHEEMLNRIEIFPCLPNRMEQDKIKDFLQIHKIGFIK